MLKLMDCNDHLSEVENETYQLIVADPPYYKVVKNGFDQQWESKEDYLEWLHIRLMEFKRTLTQKGNLLLYGNRKFVREILNMLHDLELTLNRQIIWVRKRNMSTTRGHTLASGYEPIFWVSKGDEFIFNSANAKTQPSDHLKNRQEYSKGNGLYKGVALTDAWFDIFALPHNAKEKTDHPTQKPLALSKRLVSLFSLPTDEKIYIPFGGSGSEIEACIYHQRKWDSTEIDEGYYKIIKDRIASVQIGLSNFMDDVKEVKPKKKSKKKNGKKNHPKDESS